MKKISQKRETKQLIEEQSSMLQKEMSKENREESIQEELQEQLKVAQAENDIEEVDYLTRMMQAVSQVTVKTDEERKKSGKHIVGQIILRTKLHIHRKKMNL